MLDTSPRNAAAIALGGIEDGSVLKGVYVVLTPEAERQMAMDQKTAQLWAALLGGEYSTDDGQPTFAVRFGDPSSVFKPGE